jgi:transposase
MFAALDLATGQIFYRFRDRKRWPQFLDFCKQLRRRFRTGKLYLACDNYGPHGKAEVTTWCAANDIELVYTPTNASWLNWIECEFTAVRYFTLRWQRLPQPRRPRDRDRRLHPLAQPLQPPQTPLRRQLQDPPPGLPTQRCLMKH